MRIWSTANQQRPPPPAAVSGASSRAMLRPVTRNPQGSRSGGASPQRMSVGPGADRRIGLISVDVGGTIVACPPGGLTAWYAKHSPLRSQEVHSVLRRELSCSRIVSVGLLRNLNQILAIDPALMPALTGSPPPEPLPGAIEGLKLLSAIAPVVTLSNVTALDFDEEELRRITGPHVIGHYPSCRTGYAKPDPRAFLAVCARHGVPIESLIHIGDSWECDVLAARRLGAVPIWINNNPCRRDGSSDRDVRHAHDLAKAAAIVRDHHVGVSP